VPCSKSGRPRHIQLNTAALDILRSIHRIPREPVYLSIVGNRAAVALAALPLVAQVGRADKFPASRSEALVHKFSRQQRHRDLHSPELARSYPRSGDSTIRPPRQRHARRRSRSDSQRPTCAHHRSCRLTLTSKPHNHSKAALPCQRKSPAEKPPGITSHVPIRRSALCPQASRNPAGDLR
jgi:hypothetical protein